MREYYIDEMHLNESVYSDMWLSLLLEDNTASIITSPSSLCSVFLDVRDY